MAPRKTSRSSAKNGPHDCRELRPPFELLIRLLPTVVPRIWAPYVWRPIKNSRLCNNRRCHTHTPHVCAPAHVEDPCRTKRFFLLSSSSPENDLRSFADSTNSFANDDDDEKNAPIKTPLRANSRTANSRNTENVIGPDHRSPPFLLCETASFLPFPPLNLY